jgi:hypothetical protein
MSDRVGLLACALAAIGCGPAFQNRLPGVAIAPSRMVVFPAVVREIEQDASDERTFQTEATDVVRSNIDRAMDSEAKLRGARLFSSKQLENQDQSLRQLFAGLWRWSQAATMEIAAQKTGRRDFGRRSVGGWRFGANPAALGAALEADTALIVLISETHASVGLAILAGAAHGYIYGRQLGAACLVSLHDGRMIWCEAMVDAWGNLKNPQVAGAAIHELLAGLDAPPPSASAN